MPRDPSGNYTLPALGNPAVTGTPITVAWWNGTGSDLATALTNSFDRTGATGGMTGPFKAVDGTVGAPGITFASEPTSGLYHPNPGDIRLTMQGTLVSRWTSGGFQGTVDNGANWKFPIYQNLAGQTVTSGTVDFTAGTLKVGGVNVRGDTVALTKSTSSGAFNTTSTSLTSIPNLSVGFTAVAGRPVIIQLVNDDSGNASGVSLELGGASSGFSTIAFSTDGGSTFFGNMTVTTSLVPSSSVAHMYVPSAGGLTVVAYAAVFGFGGTPKTHVNYSKLAVLQL